MFTYVVDVLVVVVSAFVFVALDADAGVLVVAMAKPAWLGSARIREGWVAPLWGLGRHHGDDLPAVGGESSGELAGQEVPIWAPIPSPFPLTWS